MCQAELLPTHLINARKILRKQNPACQLAVPAPMSDISVNYHVVARVSLALTECTE